MLPADIAGRVVAGVRGGLYRLLLGAGFSTVAQSSDGRGLPTGKRLAEELSTEFNQPPGHPLSRLWDALPSPQREAFLEGRFRNCRIPSGEPLPINKFVWRGLYTFNVDDVIEQIYKSTSSLQKLAIFTHKSSYAIPDSLATVRCIHHHGTVIQSEDGYVFSTSEYGASTARHSVWGAILADELAGAPFCVIGCTLDEYDLEHYLARRGGIDALREPWPSLFITDSPDSILEATAKRFGLVVVKATAQEFFAWLLSQAGKIPTPYELIVPSRTGEIYRTPPESQDARIFHRQFLYVNDSAFPEPIDYKNFLSGLEPTWKDVTGNKDVVRQDVSKIIQMVKDYIDGKGANQTVVLLESPPGCGKSTVLLRTSLELSRLQVPAFYLQGLERISPDSASSCISRLRHSPVLIVDSFGDHADQVAQLNEALEKAHVRCLVLGAERENVVGRMRLSLDLLRPTRIALNLLSESEAGELIRKMRSEGFLGKQARFSDSELMAKARGKDLVVAMCEIAGDHKRFDDLVKSQWEQVTNDDSKALLSAVSLSHSCGFPLKFAVAQRCARVPIGVLMKEIGSGSLRGLIFREGSQGEYLRTAHRVLAERLLGIALPPALLFDSYANVAIGISPYVSRESIRARTVEARFGGRLLDYDTVYPYLKERSREFYQRIKPAWEWNSRYWEQLASLELDNRQYAMAVNYAKQAVGIESHPHTHTTLGNVLVRSAIHARNEGSAKELFADSVVEFKRAIELGKRFKVIHVHAHHAAITGAIHFFKKWHVAIDDDMSKWVKDLLDQTKKQFKEAYDWNSLVVEWDSLVNRH